MVKKKIKLGNLHSSRDFTYVEDTVEGFIYLIGNKKSIGENFICFFFMILEFN